MISPEMQDEAPSAPASGIRAVQAAPRRVVRAPVVAVVLLFFASAALAWRAGVPAGGILLVQLPLLGVLLRLARSGRKAAISEEEQPSSYIRRPL
jgi:hypothetical protein